MLGAAWTANSEAAWLNPRTMKSGRGRGRLRYATSVPNVRITGLAALSVPHARMCPLPSSCLQLAPYAPPPQATGSSQPHMLQTDAHTTDAPMHPRGRAPTHLHPRTYMPPHTLLTRISHPNPCMCLPPYALSLFPPSLPRQPHMLLACTCACLRPCHRPRQTHNPPPLRLPPCIHLDPGFRRRRTLLPLTPHPSPTWIRTT